MSARRPAWAASILGVVASLAISIQAPAQSPAPPGCTIDESSPTLRIYQCQERLRLAAERSTLVAAIEREGRVVGFRIEGGAAFIDTGGARPGGFQIVTPQAIAESRGTRYAVDARGGRTSVFVQEGAVLVREGRREVALAAGDGIDIGGSAGPAPPSPGAPPAPAPPAPARPAPADTGSPEPKDAPLSATRWAPERVSILLARVGER